MLRAKPTQSACHDAHVPERPDSDREVLTSLPRSRPVRRSSKRGEQPAADGATRPSAKPAASRKPRAAKAAPKAAAAKPPIPAARPRATAKPGTGASRAARSRTTATPRAGAEEHPRVPPQRKIPAAGYAAPDGRAGEPSVSPAAELVSTTIQAAAELAQIGLAIGRQTFQSLLDRLPKP